jgi:hypothetical protein
MAKIETKIIIVCDKCLRASCWQGVFYCEDYRDAGTHRKDYKAVRTT